MSDATFKIRVLGFPMLCRPDGTRLQLPAGKPLGVLTYLALSGGSVSRDHLGDLFWPEASRGNQRASLRQSLWILRKALGVDPFAGDDAIELLPGIVSADLLEAERLVEEGRALEAADLWTHPPFHDFLLSETPGWELWTEDRRRQAELRIAGALHAEGEKREASGDLDTAARAFQAAARIQAQRGVHFISLIRVLLASRELEEAEECLAEARTQFAETEEVLQQLDALEKDLRALRRGAFIEEDESLPRLAFVGRVREFAKLARMWQRLEPGNGSRAIVSGEAGVGKTHLAEEIALLATNRGGRIVRVKGREGEHNVQWGIVSELVRQLSTLSGAAGVSSYANEILHLLVPSLAGPGYGKPVRRATGGTHPPRAAAESPATLPDAAVVDAVGDLVSAVCYDGPLLLVVDDLQWVDRVSQSILLSLARRTEGEPVLWIIAVRSGIPDPFLERSLRGLSEGPRTTRLRLAPWTREEVGELLGAMARFSDPEGLERTAGVIHRAGGGNPLFTVEILKLLVARGILVRERGPGSEEGAGSHEEVTWRLRVDLLPDHLPLPGSVEEFLAQQILHMSEPARRILEALLATARVRPNELQRRAGLSTPDMTAGLSELLEKRLVQWVEGDRLDFGHDQVQAAARARLSAPRPSGLSVLGGVRRRPMASAGLLGGCVLAGFLLIRSLMPGENPPPPYGGGTIMVVLPDRWFEIVPDHRPPDQWEVRSPEPLHSLGEELPEPHMGSGGAPLWFSRRSTLQKAPWLVKLLPEGHERVLVKSDGDDAFLDLSPDGEQFLYMSEDLLASTYVRDLWLGDLHGNARRRILQTERSVATAAWSPDGSRIAAWLYGDPDTLVLLTPAGDKLEMVPFSDATGLWGWCGEDRLLVTVQQAGRIAMETWFLPEWTTHPIRTGHQPLSAVCSPDGVAVLYQTVSRGEISYFLHDLSSGTEHPLPLAHDSPLSRSTWLPPGPIATPRVLEITPSRTQLRWGESALLDAWIVRSDGSRSLAEEVRWEAESPSTLSVTPEGRVYANRVGRSWIASTWRNWLSDTLWIDVTGTSGEGPLVAEEFRTLDPRRWVLVGSPLPAPAVLDGAPVLQLRGDGRHWDGILLRDPLPGMGGITVELDLKLPLTGRDRQWFRLCLFDGDLPDAVVDLGEEDHEVEKGADEEGTGVTDVHSLRAAARQKPCLTYPNHQGSRSIVDRSTVRLNNILPPNVYFTLPEPIPLENKEWVHLVLQLRADGELRVLVDRVLVGTYPFLFRNEPETRWRVGIFGAAVETESFVRNLMAWDGSRY